MSRGPVVLLVLATGCFNFERRVADCFDGGPCSQAADGGGGSDAGAPDAGVAPLDAGPFVPLDAGFFCSDDWCWESPFPHGTRLNTVAAFGPDTVVVAGAEGMLAELRNGQWVSYQSGTPRDAQWRKLWGTGPDDVFLAGHTRVWRRSDAGWSVESALNGNGLSTVTGTRGPVSEVFFGDTAGSVLRYRRDTGVLEPVVSLSSGGVLDLEVARGQVFALTRFESEVRRTLTRLDGGQSTIFSGVFSMFGSDSGLWLVGDEAFSVSDTFQLTALSEQVSSGTAAITPPRVVTPAGIKRLEGATFSNDLPRTANDVLAIDAFGGTVWAVGEAGLVLRSTAPGAWTDPTGSSRGTVWALVPFGTDLVALSESGLLVRGAERWSPRLSDAFLDGVEFQNRLYVLRADNTVLELTSAYEPVGTFPTGADEARRLWVTASGTLVVVAADGVFVKPRSESLFGKLAGVPGGGLAVGGTADLVRIAGFADGAVYDVNFGEAPVSVQRSGLTIRNCLAVARFSTGWAFGAGATTGGVAFVEIVDDGGGRRTFTILDAQRSVASFIPSPRGGLFAAVLGIAEIPIGSSDGGEVRSLLPTRIGNSLEDLIVWRGRLFAAGERGTIIQGPLR